MKGETVSINGRHEKITWHIGVDACFYENGEVMSIDVKYRRNADGSYIFYTYRDTKVEEHNIFYLGSQLMFRDFRRGVIEAFLCDFSKYGWKASFTEQGIVLEEGIRRIWVRYSDVQTKKIESLLFDNATEISVRGKKVPCRPYRWVPVD